MIRKKLNKQHLGYQLSKWLLFIPCVIGLLLYCIVFLIELVSIRTKKTEHSTIDVKNARKWFIYTALPFFGQDYFISMLYELETDATKRMIEVFGKKPYSKTLKMYMPFMPKVDALTAYNIKTGNTYEFVKQ